MNIPEYKANALTFVALDGDATYSDTHSYAQLRYMNMSCANR
jgi:hypothetical protein